MEILVNIGKCMCGGADRTGLFQNLESYLHRQDLRGHMHDPSMFSKRWRLLSNAIAFKFCN